MATLVLGAVGSAIGASIGGGLLGISAATIGGAIGTMAGSVVDSWIVGSLQPDQRYEGARLDSLRVTSATEGTTIPRVFGRMRLGGNIIWATDFTEHVSTSTQGGGKGGGPSVTTTEYSYTASFAVALCEGPITGIGRIWADGELLDTSTVTWRWYPGDEAQAADPFIAAKMGAEGAPAYRGTAYVVFEELDLSPFGNRIPQLSFEVFRPLADPDTAEGAMRAVTMIPGAGEFVYLLSNIAGGEGFDWFYASDADRDAQNRTQITDGFYDEPWTFRFKDLQNWWSTPHHDRPGGVRAGLFANAADVASYDPNPATVAITPTTGTFGPFGAPARIASDGATGHGATPGYQTLAAGDRVRITAFVAPGTSGEFALYLALGTGADHASYFGAIGGWESTAPGAHTIDATSQTEVSPGLWKITLEVTAGLSGSAGFRVGPRSATAGEDIVVHGVEVLPVGQSTTGWIPQSKPIRFTEFGCPAIDRGTNQPNVFFDPKSSESAAPYFSRGWRDDAIQRAYLEATVLYWADPVNNPLSSTTGLPMVDTSECAAWSWDARPHPFFPALTDVWSDGANWQLGHWLTGRLGAVSLAALVRHICLSAGMDATHVDVSGLWGAVEGLVIPAIESPRTTISMLARHFGFDAVESEGVIRFRMRGTAPVTAVTPVDLVAGHGEDIERTRGQETELPQVLRWSVAHADEDYDSALVEARRITTGAVRVTAESFPVAVAPEEAERRCRRALMETWTARERASFALPPSRLALDPGDVVIFSDGTATEFRLTRIADGLARRIEAVRQDREVYDLSPGAQRAAAVARSVPLGAPQLVVLDLPHLTSTHTPPRPLIAVDADPWPGTVAVLRSPETSGWASFATITRRARIGTLVSDLPAGPVWRWDRGAVLEIDLPWGQLESVTDLQLFGGANAFAVESAAGTWEILQARDVTLVAPGRYRLTTLLRGQRGTEHAIGNPAPAGARVVVLDKAVAELPFTAGEIGLPWNLAVGPGTRPVSDPSYKTLSLTPSGASLRPFAPVHLGARSEPLGDITLTWTRRSRNPAADSWEATEVPLLDQPEAWEVDILDGATVKRTLTAGTATFTYSTADQIADWGAALAPGTALTIRVAQLSPSLGRGIPAEATITLA